MVKPKPNRGGKQVQIAKRQAKVSDLSKAKPKATKPPSVRARVASIIDEVSKYRRNYTEDQIATNRTEVAPEGTAEAIYTAAERGDVAGLQEIVEQWYANAVLNGLGGYNRWYTPLMAASSEGRFQCVCLLAAQPGIDINMISPKTRSTALYCASEYGHVNIVELLCSLPEIDVNVEDSWLRDLGEPQSNAHELACKSILSKEFPDPKILERRRKIRAILEAKGVKLFAQDLSTFSRLGEVDTVRYICSLPGINVNHAARVTPYSCACSDFRGSEEEKTQRKRTIRKILEAKGYKFKNDDLYEASKKGEVDLVQQICDQPGIDVNIYHYDNRTCTPYFLAGASYSGPDEDDVREKIRVILKAKGATRMI